LQQLFAAATLSKLQQVEFSWVQEARIAEFTRSSVSDVKNVAVLEGE
jgi:hypothetical protein